MNDTTVNSEPTVEECFDELKKTFPTYKYFAVEAAEGSPRARYKVVAGPSYYSSEIQFFHAETLSAAMDKMRRWKQVQL